MSIVDLAVAYVAAAVAAAGRGMASACLQVQHLEAVSALLCMLSDLSGIPCCLAWRIAGDCCPSLTCTKTMIQALASAANAFSLAQYRPGKLSSAQLYNTEQSALQSIAYSTELCCPSFQLAPASLLASGGAQ